MAIRVTEEELKNFGEPDCVIFNAGSQPADENAEGMSSKTSIAFHFEQKEIIILDLKNKTQICLLQLLFRIGKILSKNN